jgi:hydroxymethylbilane synthase
VRGTRAGTGSGRALRLATRGSPLALVQARIVADLLRAARPGLEIEEIVVRTEGDRRPEADLDRIGGQGVFVKEVQTAVLQDRADVAVHSAKDLPASTPPGLVLAAVPARADPRDALVGRPLDGLRTGAVIATGSPRRRAQLANLRPDLVFVGLRGNMERRLGRVDAGEVDAVVAAAAALDRLGWGDRVAERLPISWCLPQVGQGALALECREEDGPVRRLLEEIDDRLAHRTVAAERAFLAALGAGCTVPVAGWAEPTGDDEGGATGDGATLLRLHGLIAGGDGRVLVRGHLEGREPEALGPALVRYLVLECGASSVDGWETVGAGIGTGFGAATPGTPATAGTTTAGTTTAGTPATAGTATGTGGTPSTPAGP